ncbi:stage VI sporulation protein D [Cytobacillus gottheilii]|uniref:stage VI sporulation protein D n=1 Tax=Cytobacillus gottheilii TaxID=859144 RepID=UPI0008313F51|nr:stage VI sporulation protein D [Cytobacillus gottheilii]
MTQGNPSCLRFSLEESVWFQRGQEVLQLISISLDPNITIQESEQYVTIQGALELTGEYNRVEADEAEQQNAGYQAKFVQSVEERDEGVFEFTHFFPVDITIPNNRIQSIEDIGVEVESFDYDFPERSCMKLNANLMISGLYGEQREEAENAVEEVVEASEAEAELEPLYRSSASIFEPPAQEDEEQESDFVTELRIEKAEQQEQEQDQEQVEELFRPFEAEARKQPEVPAVEVNEEEVAPPALQEAQIAPQAAEEPKEAFPNIAFTAQRSETPAETYVAEVEEFKQVPLEESPVQEVKVTENVYMEESSSSSEQEVKKKKKSKNSMTLTEFFARKDENEMSKLKVCIVQHGETLELLAERYEVSSQQLQRVNNLDITQDVFEGQVLYIPAVVTR